MDLEYIILNNNKAATHKFKTKATTKTLEQVEKYDNYAMIVPKGYLMLDYDTEDDAAIMLDIVDSLNMKTKVMKTTRGYHFWFKAASYVPKSFTKARLAIGIYSDCKNSNARAYAVIKQNGKHREWVRDCEWEDLDVIPKWLAPVSAPDQYEFKEMGDGDGRNDKLFSYIVYLQSKGFTKDEVIDTLEVINDFVLIDSVSSQELGMIMRDDAFKPESEITQQIVESKGFDHNEFGTKLIENYNIIGLNDRLFVYEDGYYQLDERIIERKMIEMYPNIKQRQRAEVLAFIRIQTHTSMQSIKVNPYIINLNNCRFDVKQRKKLPYNPKAIEFDRIPVKYDPAATCDDLDGMLDRVFLGDEDVIKLFDEMMGYLLLKHTRYRAGFMLYGNGSNGKSTILDMIKNFIGMNNYSAIELGKLTDRFATAELENKLANIGDDIDDRPIKDTGTLKKLFTGESLMVERKGERPFTLQPYAKMIFSMNNLPRSYDKSDGFYSRLIFIPFNAKFSPKDADFDPHIADKIMTDEAMSHLLNRAGRGAERPMAEGSHTSPESVNEAMERYKQSNSVVLQWMDDEQIDIVDISTKTRDEWFAMFDAWCVASAVKSYDRLGKIKFYSEIINVFDLDTVQRRGNDGVQGRYFVAKLDFDDEEEEE